MNKVENYNEFGMLSDNAAEIGLPFAESPVVGRRSFSVASEPFAPEQAVSAIVWGHAEPELVLLHGGGQNAHTWDTVALALGRPLIAIDLPGHGHSSRRADRDYGPWRNAEAVAALLDQAAPRASAIVGMSLGGVTAIRLAATRPDLAPKLVIVDVTPQVQDPVRQLSRADQGAVALIAGPPTYDSFEQMAEAAIAASPRRPRSAVERGVRHNSVQLPDGRWTWRYDLFSQPTGLADFTPLWDDVAAISAPIMLIRGGDSKFVPDGDLERFRQLHPGLRAETVPDSGHAVQSDQPLALTGLIEEFVFG